MVPPALAAELEKLYPWQERLFWTSLADPGPVIVSTGEQEWTDKEIEQFRAEWMLNFQRPKLLTPLPRRVRVRLACTRAIDKTAIWLVDRRQFGAAQRLWRTFRMWK